MTDSKQQNDRYGSYWSNSNNEYHRTDGPAVMDYGLPYEWWVDGIRFLKEEDWRMAVGKSKEEMLAIVLKYGEFKI